MCIIAAEMDHAKTCSKRAVVVAQLAEQLLPKPEARGSNPVIGKIIYTTRFSVNC